MLEDTIKWFNEGTIRICDEIRRETEEIRKESQKRAQESKFNMEELTAEIRKIINRSALITTGVLSALLIIFNILAYLYR